MLIALQNAGPNSVSTNHVHNTWIVTVKMMNGFIVMTGQGDVQLTEEKSSGNFTSCTFIDNNGKVSNVDHTLGMQLIQESFGRA